MKFSIIYSLVLPSGRLSSNGWSDVLSNKKRNVVVIDYPRYMQAIYNIINSPISSFDLTTRRGMAPLAFALAALSGRRMIEIMLKGEFSVAGKYTVNFSGQAKKRSEDNNLSRNYIPFAMQNCLLS
ncbi:protelomerase family protein [Klebsiella pneumoniae]|uniref:protelomerase family protein n=1 Tax=Klebsiella pneumoniae TaxID=573 RepID=UPI003B986C31